MPDFYYKTREEEQFEKVGKLYLTLIFFVIPITLYVYWKYYSDVTCKKLISPTETEFIIKKILLDGTGLVLWFLLSIISMPFIYLIFNLNEYITYILGIFWVIILSIVGSSLLYGVILTTDCSEKIIPYYKIWSG